MMDTSSTRFARPLTDQDVNIILAYESVAMNGAMRFGSITVWAIYDKADTVAIYDEPRELVEKHLRSRLGYVNPPKRSTRFKQRFAVTRYLWKLGRVG